MLQSLRKLFGVDEQGAAVATMPRPRTRRPAAVPERRVGNEQLITTSVIGRTLVVTILERELAGHYVFELAHAIREQYTRQPSLRNIVLDMENVRFLDSSGLSALVDLMSLVKPRVGMIAVAAATQQVEVLFKLTRLELVFTIRRTSIEAINAVERA